MYASASGHRTQGRSRHSRSQSDPGHSYVTPPYTIPWPMPARQTTESMGATFGTPYPSPLLNSHSSSAEHPGVSSGSPSGTSPPTSSPRSPSPRNQRSSSRRRNVRAPQESGSLFKDLPQTPRPMHAIAAPHPHPAIWGHEPGQGQGSPPIPTSYQMQRQGSYYGYQPPPSNVYQSTSTSGTHLSRHHSTSTHHHPSTSHHVVHPRSRPRPPSAASHRHASSITQPVHGLGSSATLEASRTSLNGGASSQKNHHATSPPPGTSTSYHPGTGPTHMPMPSEPPQRSHSHTRVPPSSTHEMTATSTDLLKEMLHKPPLPAANEIRRTTHRPALPANYDGQTQTRYVNMLLALDDISPLFNILASFFTWLLLAGFLLFPGTFASWKDEPAGSPQSDILGIVNHVSLYVIAWICTGIGASGMIWLWWRWHRNYVWISNRIFIPGCLNSVAGVISTLSSTYGAQGGVFGKTEKSTIIVTGALAGIFGVLVLVYELWLLRNLKLEHDRQVGVEMAGKHGEGVMGAKRSKSREVQDDDG